LAVAEADDAGGRRHIDAASTRVAYHVLDRRDARGTVSTVRARIALVTLRPLNALVSLRTLRAGSPGLTVGAGCAVADFVQVALPVLDQPAAGSTSRVRGDGGNRGDAGDAGEARQALVALRPLSTEGATCPLLPDLSLRARKTLQPRSTRCACDAGSTARSL
jgi:hypothetical protein